MAERGSAGNILAALASFFLPGLGQLLQTRGTDAVAHFLLLCFGWGGFWVMLGSGGSIFLLLLFCLAGYSAWDAAKWEG